MPYVDEIIGARFEGDEIEVARYEFTDWSNAVAWYNDTLKIWEQATQRACPVEVSLWVEVPDRDEEFTLHHSTGFDPNV